LEDANVENRKGAHTTTRLTAQLVWATKYRYHVLQGDVKVRCRQLLMQICDAEDVRILTGVVSKDHIHMHIEYPPKTALSDLVKRLKGRSSRVFCNKSILFCATVIGEDISGQSGMERRALAKSRTKLFSNILSIIEVNQTKITIRLFLIRTFSPH
jgi:putative transposase